MSLCQQAKRSTRKKTPSILSMFSGNPPVFLRGQRSFLDLTLKFRILNFIFSDFLGTQSSTFQKLMDVVVSVFSVCLGVLPVGSQRPPLVG